MDDVSPRAEEEFLRLGIQYYAAARMTALAGFLPVCGNLFHHAIEAFLKARFSEKLPLREVKKMAGRSGHELPPLWIAFKAEFPDAGLDDFDETITHIE